MLSRLALMAVVLGSLPALGDAPAVQDIYQQECWTAEGPAESRIPLQPESESAVVVRQKGVGTLSRRAAYNVTGDMARSLEVEGMQSDALQVQRIRLASATAAGVGMLAAVPVFLVWAAISAVFFFSPEVAMFSPPGGGRFDVAQRFAASVFMVALPALVPVLVLGGTGLLLTAGYSFNRNRAAGEDFILGAQAFSSQEANALVERHNNDIAKQLGLGTAPVCRKL